MTDRFDFTRFDDPPAKSAGNPLNMRSEEPPVSETFDFAAHPSEGEQQSAAVTIDPGAVIKLQSPNLGAETGLPDILTAPGQSGGPHVNADDEDSRYIQVAVMIDDPSL